MRRRIFTAAFAISCSAAIGLLACSDDDPASTPDAGTPDAAPDTSTTIPRPDGSVQVDAGTIIDASRDAPSTIDATVDAGPTKTEETRSTGLIRVAADYATALFSEDDTILRRSDAPDCIAIVRSATKPYSAAGTVTLAGQVVGSDGGPDTAITFDQASDYFYAGVVLPPTSEFTVDVSQGPFTPAFPALIAQTLRPSLSTTTTVTSPDGDAGIDGPTFPTNKPLNVTWTVPAGQSADQSFILDMQLFPSGAEGSKGVEVICSTALSKGTLTVSASLLADAKAATLPPTASAAGNLSLFAGGQKIVVIKNAVYVITAANDDSTSYEAFSSIKVE